MKTKKNFLKKLTAGILGFVMTLGVGAAGYAGAATETQAAPLTLSFSFTSCPSGWPSGSSSSANTKTYTVGGTAYTFSLGANVYYNTSKYLMLKYTTYLGLPAVEGYKLTKVVAKNSSGCSTKTKVAVSTNTSGTVVTGGTAQTWSSTSSTYTYNLSNTSANTMYYLYITAANSQIVSLDLTYEEVSSKTLSSVAVSSNHRTFTVGDTFVKETVTATYSDASTADVTNSATFSSPNMSTAGTKTISVSYTEGGTTKSTSYDITVKQKYSVTLNAGKGTGTAVSHGSFAVLSSAPACPDSFSCTGKVFDHWSTSPTSDVRAIFPMEIDSATTLYAIWVKQNGYVKVTSSTDLTDGTYLIVYETGSVAFDGSLTSFDAVSNTVDVAISDNKIANSAAVDVAAFTFTKSDGSFMGTSGKYFGFAKDDNGITTSATTMSNTVSIDGNGNAEIISSGGAYLRYNKNSGQTRFRYYKSSSYTGQQAIQLYKLSAGSSSYTVTFDANGGTFKASVISEVEVDAGDPVTLLTVSDFETRTGYTFKGWSSTDEGTEPISSFTPEADSTLYAIWEAETYSVTATCENCSFSETTGPGAATYGQQYSGTITFDSSLYNTPVVTVTMGGEDASSYYSNGTLNITSVTGDIIINATASSKGYCSITKTLTNVTIDNDSTQVVVGSSYVANFSVKNSHYSNLSVQVTMGGEDASSYYSNGTLNITSVTGAVVISASATFMGDFSLDNASAIAEYTNAEPIIRKVVSYDNFDSTVSFSWVSSNNSVITVLQDDTPVEGSISSATINVVGPGTANITITATDDLGDSKEKQISVNITASSSTLTIDKTEITVEEKGASTETVTPTVSNIRGHQTTNVTVSYTSTHFTVKNGNQVITSGSTVPTGTTLTITGSTSDKNGSNLTFSANGNTATCLVKVFTDHFVELSKVTSVSEISGSLDEYVYYLSRNGVNFAGSNVANGDIPSTDDFSSILEFELEPHTVTGQYKIKVGDYYLNNENNNGTPMVLESSAISYWTLNDYNNGVILKNASNSYRHLGVQMKDSLATSNIRAYAAQNIDGNNPPVFLYKKVNDKPSFNVSPNDLTVHMYHEGEATLSSKNIESPNFTVALSEEAATGIANASISENKVVISPISEGTTKFTITETTTNLTKELSVTVDRMPYEVILTGGEYETGTTKNFSSITQVVDEEENEIPLKDCDISWSSSDTTVVSTTPAQFTCVKPGKSTITATVTLSDGKTITDTCEIEVNNDYPIYSANNTVEGTLDKTVYDASDQFLLGDNITGVKAYTHFHSRTFTTYTDLSLFTFDTSSSGSNKSATYRFTSDDVGENITVYFFYGDVMIASVSGITVNEKIVPITDIAFEEGTSGNIERGKTLTLTPIFNPDGEEPSDARTLNWSIASTDVDKGVTVSNGTISVAENAIVGATVTVTATSTVREDVHEDFIVTVTREEQTVYVIETEDETWEKVTADQSDWSGEYLIVYEDTTNNKALLWTGVDAGECHVDINLSDQGAVVSKIEGAVSVTIAPMTEGTGYSVKVNGGTNDGKYIYGTSGSNKINFGTTEQSCTLGYNSDGKYSILTSNTSGFTYNATAGSNNERFRFYKSNGLQSSIQLYKKSGGSSESNLTVIDDLYDAAVSANAKISEGAMTAEKWSTVEGYFSSFTDTASDSYRILKNGVSNESGNEVEQFLYTYDLLVAQGYNNFLNRALITTHTITIDYNHDGLTENVVYPEGEYKLPTAERKGYDLSYWEVNGEQKQPGDTITITGDVTITANWVKGFSLTESVEFNFTGLKMNRFQYVFEGTCPEGTEQYGFLVDTSGNADSFVGLTDEAIKNHTTGLTEKNKDKLVIGTSDGSKTVSVMFYYVDANKKVIKSEVITMSFDSFVTADGFDPSIYGDKYAIAALQYYIAGLQAK